MGGVATGLALGADVMAAEAIGRNLMGHHDQGSRASDSFSNNDVQPGNLNTDMGGQDFGVTNAGSWDDAGVGGGGGDWDT